MAFTLQEWNDVLRAERKRISSIVSRARKAYETDIKLSDVIGESRKAESGEQAKEMFSKYRSYRSYHDLYQLTKDDLNPSTTDSPFSQFMPTPEELTPNEVDVILTNFTESFLNPMSGRDTLAQWTMRKWWDEFAHQFDNTDLATAISNLKDRGYDYETFYYGSDDQSTLEVRDFITLLINELRTISSDHSALDDMTSRWNDIWEYQVLPNMSAEYYESWADTHY